MAKRRAKPRAEVRPFVYCLRCATLYAYLSLREETRKGRAVHVCPAGHVVERVGSA